MGVQERDGDEVRECYERYWSAQIRPRYEPGDVLAGLIERSVDGSSRCLDVGCGAGETYAQLVSRRAASYIGVDVSTRPVATK